MHIDLTAGRVEVVVLDKEDYGAFTHSIYARPAFDEYLTLDDYADEKRATEDLLREALAKRWTKIDDFEVAWDENVAFTLCGGVYSHRILCRDYLEILHRILRTTRYRDRWAYSTAVEPDPPLGGVTYGLFVLQGDRITLADEETEWDGASFVRYFSRSAAEAARGA